MRVHHALRWQAVAEEADFSEIEGAAEHEFLGEAHPVSCIDCHDPESMEVRVTRPRFVLGIQALAEGDGEVPHLPSIEQWREGDRPEPDDPNQLATRQEMRSFVCGQCHVEYCCASKTTLTFPWGKGLKVENAETVWEEMDFPTAATSTTGSTAKPARSCSRLSTPRSSVGAGASTPAAA